MRILLLLFAASLLLMGPVPVMAEPDDVVEGAMSCPPILEGDNVNRDCYCWIPTDPLGLCD